MTQGVSPKPRRRRRWLLFIAIALGVGVALIALAPTIASLGIARSMARDAIAANINGQVEIKSLRVGWFGGQRIEGLRINDAAGNEAANVNIEVHNGLLALALGSAKPINATVSGSVAARMREDGTITLAELAKTDARKVRSKPPAGKPSEPFRVSDLPAVVINVSALSVKLDSERHQQSLALEGVNGKIAWTDSTQPLTVDLHGKTNTNGTPGSLDVTGQADQFVAADGTLTLRGASAKLDIGAKSIPLPMLERPTTVNSLNVQLASDDLTERIALQANADGRVEGAQRDTTIKIDGTLGKIIDGSGKPSFRAATAHVNAEIENLPVMTRDVQGEMTHITASIVSEDLTKTMELVAKADGQTSAKSGGSVQQGAQPSTFTANLAIAAPFAPDGTPQIAPERITGKASGKNVPSTLAQGVLAAAHIDPVRDVGPLVDVEADFPGGVQGELHVSVKGAAASAEAIARQNDDGSFTGSKLIIDAPHAAPELVAGLTQNRIVLDAPLNVRIDLSSFHLPASAKSKNEQSPDAPPPSIPLGNYAATGTITVIGPARIQIADIAESESTASTSPATPVRAIALDRIDLNIDSPALKEHLALKGTATIGGGTITIDERLTNLFNANGELAVADAMPVGTLKVENLPVETVAAFAPPERADVIRELLGTRLNANVVSTAPTTDLQAEISANGDATKLQTVVVRRDRTLAFERTVVDATVSPQLAAALQEGRDNPVVLGGPARAQVELRPFTLPLDAPAAVLATPVSGHITLTNAVLAKAPALAQALAIPSFATDFTVQMKDEITTATLANAKGTLKRGESKRDIAKIALDGTLVTGAGRLEPNLNLRLTDLNTREAEALLGRAPGEIAHWTGDQGNVDVQLQSAGDDLVAKITPAMPNVQGEYQASVHNDVVSITAQTSRLVLTKEALQARLNPPAQADVGSAQARADGGPPGDSIRVEADVPVQLVIRRLEFPKQVFTNESFDAALVNLDIDLTSGALPITNPDGVKSTLKNLHATLKAADLNKGVRFALKGDAESIVPAAPPEPQAHEHAVAEIGPATTRPDETLSDKEARREARREERRESRSETRPAESISTPPPAATQPQEQHIAGVIDVTGTIANLINSERKIDIAQSRLQMDGKVTAVPTAVADALASMEGLLVAAVGSRMNATFQADDFSKDSGTLNARIDTTNGHVETVVHGREGSFRINKNAPLKGELDITRALRERLLQQIHPILADLHTTEQPVRFEIPTALAAIPADVSKLRAEMNISIGKVEFDSGSTTLKILTFFGEDDHSVIPGEIEPISAKIRNGVVTYDKFAVHIDKYTLNYSGQVDLVKRLVDVRTEIPLSALKHEVEELSGFADNMTVPLVTRGTFGNLKTMIDPDFDLGKAAIDAGFKGTIDQLLKGEGGLFKDLFDKPKEE